jgi:hypothetical protein
MRALPSLLHVLVTFAALASTCGAGAEEDPSSVGTVNRVENEAQVISASGALTAAVGTPVHMKDELRTGANARLQVTFRDNTLLTFGEHASVVIDRYVYDPDRGVGETVLQATKGAFRFATGRIKEMKDHKIAVSTPVADIGVRGTEFWGGPSSNMGCCCSKEKSACPTRREASCWQSQDKAPTSPRRSIGRESRRHGLRRRSLAPSPPLLCTNLGMKSA